MMILSTAEMRQLENYTTHTLQIANKELMETAGTAVAAAFLGKFSTIFRDMTPTVLVLCGPGNNGGDGLVTARHLLAANLQPRVVIVRPEGKALSTDAEIQLKNLKAVGGAVSYCGDSATLAHLQNELADQPLLVIDALFGTGLKKGLNALYVDLIDWLNRHADYIISVDIPSGMDADQGVPHGAAVRANLTVTFGYPKVGMFVGVGPELCGEVVVADIGIPQEATKQLTGPRMHLANLAAVRRCFSTRPLNSYKNSYGHVLVVAGSLEKSGAAVLTSRAALRAGAGLLTLATPLSAHTVCKAQLLEAMSMPLQDQQSPGCVGPEHSASLLTNIKSMAALAIGPGLKPHDRLTELLGSLLQATTCPMVIDADGLNALAKQTDLLKKRQGEVVLTPHPAEMARLLGCTTEEVQTHRTELAREFAKRYGVHVVLKGFRTVIAYADGEILINPTGNPGMASAGMGDVLTGILAGYLAQGAELKIAVQAAVYNHGWLGDLLLEKKGERGMLASDLIEELPMLQARLYPHAERNRLHTF